jgi:hypothetical protein
MRGMMLIVIALSVVVLVQPAAPPQPRWWRVGLLALLIQLPPFLMGQGDALLRIAYGLLLAVAWANRRLPGGPLILAGLTLNALPIFVYGRMPLSSAMALWGQHDGAIGALLPATKGVVVRPTPLLMLGDIIPLHLFGWRAAWSIGDLLLCAGVTRYCLAGASRSSGAPWSTPLDRSANVERERPPTASPAQLDSPGLTIAFRQD